MTAERVLDSQLNIQDKIRLRLGEAGTKYVPITVPDLAAELRVPNYTAYQAIARLKRNGEVSVEKDGRNVIGLNIIKLEPSGRTYQRAAERAKESVDTLTPLESIQQNMTALNEYMNKKLAILEMQQRAEEAGLDPQETVKFEPNPVAEEGILILKLLTEAHMELRDTKKQLEMMSYDLAAERRNVEYLQKTNREETRRDLIASASG